MTFTTPTRFFVPYASLPNPPVGTVLYDRVYNDDLASIKVQLMNTLNMDRLPNMPIGFPFCVVYDRGGGFYKMSRESYEFQEHFCLSDHRARTRSVTFSYTAPSKEQEELSWRFTVPSRGSSVHEKIPSRISIAQVRVDLRVLELSFGLALMTESHILLRYLSRSMELGVLITITVAKCKTPMIHPTDRNLDYHLGDIICIATENDNRSRVVYVIKS